MDNLEPCLPSAEDARHSPNVPRLPLLPRILQHNIRDFKHSQRERVFSVLPDGLEDAGEE